jgi:hypothetical protein
MCGIFGLAYKDGLRPANEILARRIERLFLLSETRGKEAAGLAVLNPSKIDVYKDGIRASRMLKTAAYRAFLDGALSTDRNGAFAAIGHARLVTNGMQSLAANNQPVVRDNGVVVHNGIIVNDEILWAERPHLKRQAEVDTEIIPALLREKLKSGDVLGSLRSVMNQIEGEATIAQLLADADLLLLATNTGSLYVVSSAAEGCFAFVSEEYQAHEFAKDMGGKDASVRHLPAGSVAALDLHTHELILEGSPPSAPSVARLATSVRTIEDSYARQLHALKTMRRCMRCILPETMPFIEFDAEGVCNFCHNHVPVTVLGREALERRVEQHREKSGNNCFVALSGGRDSCYGLHVLKKELGLNPIAYTYDWGMVTSIARRNQARMCGSLGVEHLWVSADIKTKRRNIRNNLLAWLKRPHLGMIPILMAGDKQFFFYANQLSARMGIELSAFCMNAYERTDFKTGFAGVPPKSGLGKHYHLSGTSKASVALFYGAQYLQNPRYLNTSISDTAFAYLSYYFTKQDYLYLFDYIDWEEPEVEDVLINQYGFERPADTLTTWRIGDGTAPFYNYVYHTVAGFTEFDTFRSNQIREGKMTRDEALVRIEHENEPRWASIKEYLELVGVDFDDAIKAINRMPKLYER